MPISLLLQKLRKTFWPIYLMALATFIFQIPDFFGEDIINARNNYLYGGRTDFWGGISTLVYSQIPNFGVRWQIWLALFQLSITSIGLIKLITSHSKSRTRFILKIMTAYSILFFSSQMTRDGLLFSLLIFGFGILKNNFVRNASLRSLLIPILLISFGMSFRPWLSIAIIPLVLSLFVDLDHVLKRNVIVSLGIILAFAPLLIEVSTTKILGLSKSFPEQQVMLMDAGASYCYTNNPNTGDLAKQALTMFSQDTNFPKVACQLYRPDTWISLIQGGNTSSEGLVSNLHLIQPGEMNQYQLLKSAWIKLILRDPVTYIQNKTLFSSKLLIGSDSRDLTVFSAKTHSARFLATYRTPFELAIAFHVFSILGCILLLLILPMSKFCRNMSTGLHLDKHTLLLFMSLGLWVTFSSIAYVGSNGRYTYSATLLALVIYLEHISQKEYSNVPDK